MGTCRSTLLCILFVFSIGTIHGQWVHKNGQGNGGVRCFAVTGDTILAGTRGGGIFCSTDSGAHWSPLNAGLPGGIVRALGVAGGRIIAGTDSGMFVLSADRSSWAYRSGAVVNAFAVLGGTVLAGTEAATIVMSTNAGETWTIRDTWTPLYRPLCFAVRETILFAGVFNAGVHVSTDSGAHWTGIGTGLTSPYVLSLHSLGPSLYAGTISGALISEGGAAWVPINDGLADGYVSAFSSSGSALVAGTSSGVYVSRDGGGSWTRSLTAIPSSEVSAFARLGTRLFAGTFDGIFVSTDDGVHWTEANTGLATGVGDPEHPGRPYLYQNYPNPFNPATTIGYVLPARSKVTLSVLNVLGQVVAEVKDGEQEAGFHQVVFDGTSLSSGVYFCRLQVGESAIGSGNGITQIRRLLLVR